MYFVADRPNLLYGVIFSRFLSVCLNKHIVVVILSFFYLQLDARSPPAAVSSCQRLLNSTNSSSSSISSKPSFVRILIFYISSLDSSKHIHFFQSKSNRFSLIFSNALYELLTSYIRRYSVVDVIERNTYCMFINLFFDLFSRSFV